MARAHHLLARLALLAAVAVSVCLMATGCGGDDAPAAADQPEPRKAPAFAEHVAALLAEADGAEDCKRVAQIDRRSSAELPCPAPEALRERMDAFEMVDFELYNSDRSAVVNYEYDESGATSWMVLLQDYDRRWQVQRLDVKPDRPSGNDAREGGSNLRVTIQSYEAAVRAGDCKAITRLTYRPVGAPRPSCKEQLAATAPLRTVLKSDTGQRPGYNGGGRDFAFYSMTAYFPKPTHHTFTVTRAEFGGESRYFVSDVIRDEG